MVRPLVVTFLLVAVCPAFADGPPGTAGVQIDDPLGDAVLRRTDVGADGPVGEPAVHHWPDVTHVNLGNWQPFAPAVDPYSGTWVAGAPFVRIDLRFAGLINPPGTLGLGGSQFDPFKYGPHPVFGFVEIDVDDNVMTGGETWDPGDRYLGNVARFGGKPAGPRFADRVALSGLDALNPFNVPPFTQRSGEEFHVALLGEEITAVVVVSGDFNSAFDPGETWLVHGTLFHLAHGYEEFLIGPPFTYEPMVDLRWSHNLQDDATEVTLVYPLTNDAWIAMSGTPQAVTINHSAADQNSVFEALNWLVFSAINAPLYQHDDPEWPIIAGWATQSPGAYFNTAHWNLTVLVGTSYTLPADGGALYAWTDVAPNPVPGDVNGDGVADALDAQAIAHYIQINDGNTTVDADAVTNGAVTIADFAWNFSIYDLNYDGLVDSQDVYRIVIPGDMDLDLDCDAADLGIFVAALLYQQDAFPAADWPVVLQRGDFNSDGRLNGADVAGFIRRLLLSGTGSGAGGG